MNRIVQLLLLAFTLASTNAFCFQFYAGDDGQFLRFDHTNLSYTLDGGARFNKVVADAFQAWSVASGGRLRFHQVLKPAKGEHIDISVRMQRYPIRQLPGEALLYQETFGHTITGGLVFADPRVCKYALLREIGHVLGLDNSDDPLSIVSSTIVINNRNPKISPSDVVNILTLYGSGD